MDAYGIFQGGGAKGYAHVGALKAAEDRGIRFIRIAGTSAGAIIAALAAAGYTADELLDPSHALGQRGVLDVAIADIIDPVEYARVLRTKSRYEALSRVGRPRPGPLGAWQRAKRQWPPLLVLRALKFIALEVGSGVRMYRRFGAVGTEPVVEWLDGLLRAKVGASGPVTFGDLNMRLRMVAANLTTGEVQRFGFAADRDSPVAAAAVASACFPFFFRPVRVGADVFVDGGLVSNLPVWLFDDERDDDTSYLPTFGFRLVNDLLVPNARTAPARFVPYAFRIFQTLSSGARNLEERRVDYYHGIDLQARIGTLSFEVAREEAPALVEEARRCVERYFEREVGPQDPERMRRVLAVVVDMVAERYEWRGERVRAHVLVPEPDGRHARTVYAWNMEQDADDHLRVRTDVDGVGAVFRLREPVYVRLGAGGFVLGALKYELSARPSGVSGLYAIPMFEDVDDWGRTAPLERSRPFGALVIDCGTDFAPITVDVGEQDALANIAVIVGEEIRDRSIVRADWGAVPSTSDVGFDPALSSPSFRVAMRKLRDPGDQELGRRLSNALVRLNRRASGPSSRPQKAEPA